MTDPLFERRLLRKDNGCLEYTGATSCGYGRVRRYGKLLLAHRYAWELAKGEIPDGMFICHKCDNPPCCNVNHLFLGTRSDNMKDAHKKGRLTYPVNAYKFKVGSKPLNALLSDKAAKDLVAEILSNTKRGAFPEIAKKHGVPYQLVRDISAGRSYISIAKALKDDAGALDPGSTPGTSSTGNEQGGERLSTV